MLSKIMKPKSIAVIGASTKPKTIGSELMQRLRDYKFQGNIYPVYVVVGVYAEEVAQFCGVFYELCVWIFKKIFVFFVPFFPKGAECERGHFA